MSVSGFPANPLPLCHFMDQTAVPDFQRSRLIQSPSSLERPPFKSQGARQGAVQCGAVRGGAGWGGAVGWGGWNRRPLTRDSMVDTTVD